MAELHPVQQDFRKFMYLVWKTLNLPDPTPVQYDIAKYLQNSPKRAVIEAFRGVGKSWITSAFVCWILLNDPQKKILVVLHICRKSCNIKCHVYKFLMVYSIGKYKFVHKCKLLL